MRIQHNIMAMNAYRNYGNNTSALSKNLEKLSSGYRINRAGDDAAGLAISEKMRAQIQGLNAAQKNVKDGISLVKTAEGAMQEIQDMLSRMKYLATQSANGTYDDDVDRAALQDEVNQLRDEINRIADSANFNGTKLLDGSLGGGAAGGASSSSGSSSSADVALTGSAEAKGAVADGTKVKQETGATLTKDTDPVKVGDKVNITIEMDDGTKYSFDLEVAAGTGNAGKLKYNGKDLAAGIADITAGITNVELATALKEIIDNDKTLSAKFDTTGSGASGAIKLKSQTEGFGDPSIKVVSTSVNGKNVENVAGSVTVAGKGEYSELDASKLTVYNKDDSTKQPEDSIFTINGQKFAFAKDADSAKALGSDVNVVVIADPDTGIDNTDVGKMIDLINQKLGTNIQKPATGVKFDLISKGGAAGGAGGAGGGSSSGGGGGLKLQIGDTADSYNQLLVSVDDMHTTAIGIAAISIADIDSAASAIDTIKDAINSVSSTRGTLGAIQNRLEHTQKNLSVMAENIQDAESTIRDTDVADEMMAYTKNNILIQSAQAMLAQANAVPQGVLQLLG